MTLTRNANYDRANHVLSLINLEAEHSAGNNLQSYLVHLEDTYCGLLNLVYGLNLVNVNAAHANFPGIDLIDETTRVCVQVTADTSPIKMKDTLAKPVMESLAKGGYTLKFCYVGEQNKNAKRRHPTNPFGVKFDASEDVILTCDILSAFSHQSIDKQEGVLSLLNREGGKGRIITADWMRGRLDRAVKLLGPRYTPEANVNTPDMKMLAAFSEDSQCRDELLKYSKRVKNLLSRLADEAGKLEGGGALDEALDALAPISAVLEEMPESSCSVSEFGDWAVRLDASVSDQVGLWNVYRQKSSLPADGKRVVEDCRHGIRELEYVCLKYGIRFLRRNAVLVRGEAGIGKSHLLADFCTRELELGNAAIMLLGSQFHGQMSSEEDIPAILGLSGTLDDLLAEIQRYSSARGSVGFLVIDALNEGNGRSFWRDALPDLLEKAKAFPNVRLLLSVRSSYVADVVPECLVDGDDYLGIDCEGFGDSSSTALTMFCDYYGISRPLTPLIGMEFSNPLYLKLLCKHARKRGGRLSVNVAMGDLVSAFLDEVNDKLAAHQRLDYDRNIRLVFKAVSAIVSSSSFRWGSIRYEEASRLVIEKVRDYVSKPGDFLAELVSEGVFYVTGDREARFLAFSYELVGNYAASFALVQEAKALERSGDCGSRKEALAKLLQSKWDWVVGDQGTLAALGVIVPLECGCEIYDLGLDADSAFSVVPDAFVDGLPWRNITEVTPEMDGFIRRRVLTREYTRRGFFATAFQLATRHDGIDANYYCSLLLPFPMPERDAMWSSAVAQMGYARTFAEWAWENGDKLDDASAESASTLLALCFAGTNVLLRREAIKALAITLIDRPAVAEHIWNLFSDIDDDYVLEGLCGAIYGAAVNSKRLVEWEDVARAVYEFVIGDGKAYPNAVVRDYVILLHDAVLGESIEGTSFSEPFKPRFRSDWYDELPGNEEIDELLGAYEGKYGEGSREASNVWWIVGSMTTEYGRGAGMYGDFGRYTLGYHVAPWASQFDSDQLLSNVLTKHILTKWYRPELHAEYDSETKRLEGYGVPGCERIGKKYQKIALNRLMARLADNFPPKERYADEAEEPLSGAELYEELAPLRSDDPSFPWKPSTLESPYDLDDVYPSIVSLRRGPESWCRSDSEFEALDGYRSVTIDGTRYYTLAVYRKWSASKRGRRCREATWISYAMLARREDLKGVFGHYPWSEVSSGYYNVRFGEYFNGLGYRAMRVLYGLDSSSWGDSVVESWCSYDWPSDRSELDVNSVVFLPCESLVCHFGLVRRGSLRWETADGKPLALCLVSPESNDRVLLFDAESLDEYLEETDRTLMWDEYFEKQTRLHIYRKWTNVICEEDGYEALDTDRSGCYDLDRNLWCSDEWAD